MNNSKHTPVDGKEPVEIDTPVSNLAVRKGWPPRVPGRRMEGMEGLSPKLFSSTCRVCVIADPDPDRFTHGFSSIQLLELNPPYPPLDASGPAFRSLFAMEGLLDSASIPSIDPPARGLTASSEVDHE